MKKILSILGLILTFTVCNISFAKQPYVHGGLKFFDYGLESGDLQTINTSLVALGFSSSTSSTDNSGVGFEFGVGYDLNDNFAIEGSYVDLGTLEINTTTTGPAESIKTEIDGHSFAFAGVVKFGEPASHFYGRAGMHSWDLSAKVTTSLGSSSDALGDGTDPWFGVGYRHEWFRIGYDYYKMDDSDITSITGSIVYNF